VIAVDTNILVHAHREDSDWHEKARELVTELAESGAPWAIPWPCVHEFIAVVTHPRIWRPPTPLRIACDAVEAWRAAPGLVVLAETEGYWERLRPSLEGARIAGPRVHDARIASLCLLHGVKELWSADRDFHAFPALKVRNPLIAPGR
jgi:toxin-antitoxin system PIN domain toxin